MSIARRIRHRLAQYSSVAVWGAGGLGRTAMRYWLPHDKVKFVVDANPAQSAARLAGLPIQRPSQIDLTGIDVVVICTSAYMKVYPMLKALGYDGPILYIYDLFLPEGNASLSELEALAIDVAVSKNDDWPVFIMMKPQIMVNITFRIGNWAAQGGWRWPIYYLFFFLHSIVCLLTSIQLPLGTKIGPGLLFAHYGTIVFTRRAKIGAFFTIYHGCTVGTNDTGEGPWIGDYVYQYAGAHVLGRCRIGSRSRVGANSVALDMECEPGSTVVGIPARVIKS